MAALMIPFIITAYYNAGVGGGNGGILQYLPPAVLFVQVINGGGDPWILIIARRNASGNKGLYQSTPKYDFIKLVAKHRNREVEDRIPL
ncbi:MAG: hypothetical protein U5L96_15455 [Owenweeksia sp.]|nr:hypothetical protein [Owenweeksia sp.]